VTTPPVFSAAREIALQNRFANSLVAVAAFLTAFVVLFLLRSSDNNSLFSWAWAFAGTDPTRIYLALLAALLIALLLSRFSVPERFHLPLLAGLSFAAAMPFWSESELILDASRYFTQAKHLALYGIPYFVKEWGRAIPAWTDLPLVPLFYGLIFKTFGESRTAIQLFTTILFSFTLLLTYQAGKTLWNREIGFSAALMLLGMPYLLTQVPLMLVDVPTMFLLMLSLVTFLGAVNKGGAAHIAGSAIVITCTMLAKYSAWFLLSVLGIALIAYAMQNAGQPDRRRLWRGIVVLIIAAVLSGTVLALNMDTVSQQITLLREYQKPGLSRWGESLVSTFLFQIHPFITVFALLSIYAALSKRDARYAVISWLVLLVVAFGIRRVRYTLPVFPMVALMAGYGLQLVRQDELRRLITYGIASTSLVIAVFVYLPLAAGMSAVNLKHAGAYLDTLGITDVEVVTLPPREPIVNHAVSVPLLDLFTNKRLHYRYEPAVFPTREEIERSSLRFTWEYRNPAYYGKNAPPAAGNNTLVVIADAFDKAMPASFKQNNRQYLRIRTFCINDSIFKHTVGIGVYHAY
jgi:4-amino-4-deoxy-L-arabinose transferase-like glycosyltransferase